MVLLLISCSNREPLLPDLRESFRYDDSRPMGTSLARSMLEDAYPAIDVLPLKKSFTGLYYDLEDTASLFFMTGKKLYATKQEAEDLLAFVERGNTVFASAQEIDSTILELIGCSQYKVNAYAETSPFSFINTRTSLLQSFGGDSTFGYFYLPVVNFFNSDSLSTVNSIGFNAYHRPNFVVYFKGNGALFLHCDPRVLSNYFLLHNKNDQYFREILSILPEKVEHVYLDNYYSKRNYKDPDKKRTLLSFIYDNPALAWAFSILLAAFLIYVLMNGKRKQRVIPIVKPVENATVAFAEAIAGLYRQEKENKDIAEKMVAYFYEDIRIRYFINTSKINEDFLITLSRKSGNETELTKNLFYTIQMIQDSAEVSDELLLQLNEQIQQFKKS